MVLKTRHWDRLGNGGVSFTEIGMGTAPLGNLYKAISDDEAHAVLERASRQVKLKGGNTLELFFDVQNLYNRENVAGFSVDERNFEAQPDGTVDYIPTEETWIGVLPSFGVSWKF